MKLSEILFEQEEVDQRRELVNGLMKEIESEFSGVDVWLSYDKFTDSVVLSKIVIKKELRGRGIGSAVMKRLTDFADRNDMRIILTPSGDFGGSVGRLNQFYKGFGFRNYRGYRHREKMQRDPVVKLSEILFEEEDYRGGHRAPDKSDAPLFDVTLNGIYPEDFYSGNGARYYGDGSSGDSLVVSLVQRYRNKPSGKIKIYRAVPDEPSLEEQIDELEAQKKYVLRTGKVPKEVNTPLNGSEYYEYIHKVIERLKERVASGEQTAKKDIKDINPGDWVTIYRPYAVGHGKGVLNNKYKILSKTVKASELFTDGNSVYEWGYNP